MSNFFLRTANNLLTSSLVHILGLPQPKPLVRQTGPYSNDELRGKSILVVDNGKGFAAEKCREWLVAHGGMLDSKDQLNSVIVDATGCATIAELKFLYEEMSPIVRRLAAGGRVLLLANDDALTPEGAACARAIEGFTRSLGKEIGRRGATANCIYLKKSDISGLGSSLDFFCTDRSTYVSGQMLRLRNFVETVQQDLIPAFAGKTAVVTGAAGGLGAATARRLASDGAFVVCVDIPQVQDVLEQVATEIGGMALPLDITAPDAPRQFLEVAKSRGGIDIMVHNAGITRDRTLAKMSGAEWDKVMDVNLRAVLSFDEALDAAGALRDGGREIYLSSISGIAGNVGQTNYSAAKAALIGYVAARAEVVAARGVTVNAIAPGFIETAMSKKIPFMIREVGRRLNSLSQSGRPEDVAEAIAFLVRQDSKMITGQTLRVCGQSFLGA